MRSRNHEYGVEIQNIKYRVGSLESSMKEMKEVKSSMDAIAYLSKFIDGFRGKLISDYLKERAEEKKAMDECPRPSISECTEFDSIAYRNWYNNTPSVLHANNMQRIESIYKICFGEPITDAILNDCAKGE